MSISFDTLRISRTYTLTNYGEETTFVVLEMFPDEHDFTIKDIHTLEVYRLSVLVNYGKGEDFSIEEV